MLASLYSLATIMTMILAAFGFGRPLVRCLKVGNDGSLASSTWSIGLGFVFVAWVLSVAAFAGALTPASAGVLTVIGSFWGIGELACLYLAFRHPVAVDVTAFDEATVYPALPRPPQKGWWLAFSALTACSIAGLLIAALAPPISPSSLSAGLELPKSLLLGDAPEALWASTPASPRLGGMIYAWAIALDGPVAASLAAGLFGVLLAAATGLLARSLIGRDWGWYASAIVLLTPGIAYQMAAPLDDLPMAAFATLALAAWWRGAADLASPRWFVMAGIFTGAALATKAAAIAMVVSVAAVWFIENVRRVENRREIALGAARCLVVALPIASPWWTWAIVHDSKLAPSEIGTDTLISLGPLLLALLPGLLVSRRLRGLNSLLGIAVCYCLASWLIVPECRVFTPLVPLLAIGITWVLMELGRLNLVARRTATASVAVIAAFTLAGNLIPVADRWRVAIGWEQREEYLRRHVPSYSAAAVANRVIRTDSRLLSEDPCGLYFECPVTPVAPAAPSSSAIAADAFKTLSASGITHLLLCSTKSAEVRTQHGIFSLDQEIRARFNVSDDDHFLPLTEYQVIDDSGNQRHYRLLMLRR